MNPARLKHHKTSKNTYFWKKFYQLHKLTYTITIELQLLLQILTYYNYNGSRCPILDSKNQTYREYL